MKKVAFFAETMYLGGLEKVLVNLLKALDPSKIHVDLYLISKCGELLEQIPETVHVMELPTSSSIPALKGYLSKGKFISVIEMLFSSLVVRLTRRAGMKKADKKASDFINAKRKEYYLKYGKGFFPHYDKVIAFSGANQELGFYFRHDMDADQKIMWLHDDFYSRLKPHYFDGIDRIICVSEALKKGFLKAFPECEAKTQMIYNLMDVEEILVKAKEPVDDMKTEGVTIVTVGRLSEEKGVQLIPATAKRLADQGLSFEWYIVGNGGLRDKIENELQRLQLRCVHLLGGKINPYPYIKNCTLYVQPSFSEAYCTAVVEAKILQKPIVVTGIPSFREQITHDVNGYIAPETSASALAEGIEYLLRHPERMAAYAQNLKETDEDWNRGRMEIENLLYS